MEKKIKKRDLTNTFTINSSVKNNVLVKITIFFKNNPNPFVMTLPQSEVLGLQVYIEKYYEHNSDMSPIYYINNNLEQVQINIKEISLLKIRNK